MRKLYTTIKQKLRSLKRQKREGTRAAIERIHHARMFSRQYSKRYYIKINGLWFNKALRPMSWRKARKIDEHVDRLLEYKSNWRHNDTGAPFTLREHDQNVRIELENRV